MKTCAFILMVVWISVCFAAQPVSTYSIVARDPDTGELGAAVQSHYFSVGSRVIWAEAGTGAVATQSFTEVSYGPLGLVLMRAGKTAPEALRSLITTDKGLDVRQIAMIDSKGNVAAHTGKKCIVEAGDQQGRNYSVQANLMEKSTVWPAMAQAFESTKGTLAARMLAALEAAEKEGGDIRGKQSAAILVVAGKPTGLSWKDRILELRVEDHPEPLKELRRLMQLHEAYKHTDRGDEYLAEKNVAAATAEYRKSAELAPENTELLFWAAVSLYTAGDTNSARDLFKKVFSNDPERRWHELVGRLPASDLLPKDAVDKIRQWAPSR